MGVGVPERPRATRYGWPLGDSSPGTLCWNPKPQSSGPGVPPLAGQRVWKGQGASDLCRGLSLQDANCPSEPHQPFFLAGSYVNYPTSPRWLQIINSDQHKQELMCLERFSEFFLLPFFLPFFLSHLLLLSLLFFLLLLYFYTFSLLGKNAVRVFPKWGS